MMDMIPAGISAFLDARESSPLIDVRSEGEFAAGHIPGAVNIAVLPDEERRQVGICYKNNGHTAAVDLGYKLVGHRFYDYIKQARKLSNGGKIRLHCWRGGLRSRIMAQLLSNAGFEVMVLTGGYKTFRQFVLKQFEVTYPVQIISGLTGSGKTELLQALKNAGEQVIDLEKLASHKGSAFGALGLPPQPTQEQFENELALQLFTIDVNRPVFMEDESRSIGSMVLPEAVWNQMREAEYYEIQVPFEQRVQRIISEYGDFPKHILAEKTMQLKKRLGDKRAHELVEILHNNEMRAWVEGLFEYYDKTYNYGRSKRPLLKKFIIPVVDIHDAVAFLNEVKKQKGAKAP